MRKTRIFVEQPLTPGATTTLDGQAARHVAQVLRKNAGDSLWLFDGSGREYQATIQSARKTAVEVTIGEPLETMAESSLDISLWHGLCRNDRMDSVVQKATEMGVRHIQPVLTEHSVIRLDASRAEKKRSHWQQIAVSACEQSGRTIVPAIGKPTSFMSALSALDDTPCSKLICAPGSTQSLQDCVVEGLPVIALTGPEGGFSPAEISAATQSGFRSVSLGPRILRTETAPIVILTLLQNLAGDL